MNTTLYYPVDNTNEFINYTISDENVFTIVDNKIHFNDNSKPLIKIKDELSKYLYNNDDELFNEEDEIKENKSLTEFNVSLNKFRQSLLETQDKFLESEKKFKDELKKTKKDVESLEKMIEFINNLDDKFKDDEIYKEIIEKINILTTKIEKNNNMKLYKKEYIKYRRSVKEFFEIIKSLNNLNMTALCPLCLSNPVDVYINPCGHCSCSKCKDRLLQYEGSVNQANCFICRKSIMGFNKLFLS